MARIRKAAVLIAFIVLLVLIALLVKHKTLLTARTKIFMALWSTEQSEVDHSSKNSEVQLQLRTPLPPDRAAALQKVPTSRKVNVTMTPLPPTAPAEATSPQMVLFTTWVSRPNKRAIHDNVLRTWRLISPTFTCVLFSDEEEERERAKTFGWLPAPLPRTACGGLPIFREMFYSTMRMFPTARLFGFVNSDILLGATLRDTLQSVLEDSALMAGPALLLLSRVNVPFSNESRVNDLQTVETLKLRGKPLGDGSSDAFFTNRWFPWHHIPDIVPGRLGIGMWLVFVARVLNVTVVNLTPTVTTLHLTSSAGNHESHQHDNAMCNRHLYKKLGVRPSSWNCGFIQCADSRSVSTKDSGVLRVQIKRKKDRLALKKSCQNCQFNTTNLLKLNTPDLVNSTQ